ncbi:MAG: hypothetical protein J6T26_07425 [Firmicutes bacterium]|nr:hypothetical protein [Bacillota bacterium]
MLWRYVLPVVAGLFLVLLACLLPERFLRGALRLALNATAGLALLLLLNNFTALTLAVGTLLGAPGVAAVAVIAAV